MSAQASGAVNGIAGRLQAATADEVLRFIDKELGVS